MDLTIFDVGTLPAGTIKAGDLIDLIGPGHDIDAVAQDAGTIGYEVLTSLGRRYHRAYQGGTN